MAAAGQLAVTSCWVWVGGLTPWPLSSLEPCVISPRRALFNIENSKGIEPAVMASYGHPFARTAPHPVHTQSTPEVVVGEVQERQLEAAQPNAQLLQPVVPSRAAGLAVRDRGKSGDEQLPPAFLPPHVRS